MPNLSTQEQLIHFAENMNALPPSQEFIAGIVYVLEKATEEATVLEDDAFSADLYPPMPLQLFLSQINTKAKPALASFVLALIYIQIMQDEMKNTDILNSTTVYTLFLIGLMIAEKSHRDEPHNNKYYSKISTIALKIINDLESEFLFRVNFKLEVNVELFDKVKMGIKLASLQVAQDREKSQGISPVNRYTLFNSEEKEESSSLSSCEDVVANRLT